MPHRSDFGTPFCLRPPEAGSALGSGLSRPHLRSLSLRPGDSWSPPRETLSIGFRILVSRHPAIQTTGRLTFAPAGLSPAEHTSLYWTHFRTAGFPQYGWKAGFPGGVFPDCQRLKPAPGIRRPNIRFASALRAPRSHDGCPALCRAEDSIARRRGGSLLLRPRGPRSGPGYSVPVRHHLVGPIRPTRGHTAISPHGGLYAMPSLCGSA